MTRVRFDPSFVEDERWERLGTQALVLHLAAVAFTVRTLSDGIVTKGRVRTLTPLVDDPETVTASLVEDGLWTINDDGSMQVCQVRDDLRHADGRGDEQPSRAFVEKEKARVRDSKAKWKAKRESEGNAVPIGIRNGEANDLSGVGSSAVQDPKGPGPAPTPAADALTPACDAGCDGSGWIPAADGESKCRAFSWHQRKAAS